MRINLINEKSCLTRETLKRRDDLDELRVEQKVTKVIRKIAPPSIQLPADVFVCVLDERKKTFK